VRHCNDWRPKIDLALNLLVFLVQDMDCDGQDEWRVGKSLWLIRRWKTSTFVCLVPRNQILLEFRNGRRNTSLPINNAFKLVTHGADADSFWDGVHDRICSALFTHQAEWPRADDVFDRYHVRGFLTHYTRNGLWKRLICILNNRNLKKRILPMYK